MSAALAPLVGKVRSVLAGRSWWQVRYTDGRVISEWEGLDWLDLPRRGLVEGRLICPNGQTAVLGNTRDLSDRLFQFKVGVLSAGLIPVQAGGLRLGAHPKRQPLAHVMGVIHGTDGQCSLFAWDYGAKRLVGPLADNANALRYQQIGPIHGPHLGVRPD